MNQQPLRHSIVYTAKRRTARIAPAKGFTDPANNGPHLVPDGDAPAGAPDLRLFWMSDRQAQLFEDAVLALLTLNGRITRDQATELVEKFVIRLLGGQMPAESSPTTFHRLRLAFPILKREQIEQHRRAGCPEGWIDTLVLTMMDGRAKKAIVVFDMAPHQSLAFNDALGELMATKGVTRDVAWAGLNNLIGMLIAGGCPPKAEPFVHAMAEHFPRLELNEETINAGTGPVRRATEYDVRRWSFTTLPPGDAHAQF